MSLIELITRKLKCNKGQTIILDTSALESEKIMQVIEDSQKVILLCRILDEMDNHKSEAGLFGFNIREVSRKSREDEKSKKYICVAGYERHSYNDKNIIDYCRLHRKTIIVTCDNNLCNLAKAYGIHYMYLEKSKKEEKQVLKVKKKKQKNITRQQVKGVIYKGKKLYLCINRKDEKFFLYRNEKMIEFTSSEKVELEVGDIIFMIKNSNEQLTLTEYEIQVISENNYAFCKNKELIESCKNYDVKEKKFPKEVTDYILNFFNPKSNNENVQLDEKKKGNKEVHFYRNWIGVNRYKDYHTEVKLEKNGKLINLQDYQEGDYLYILRYNISNRYVEITVYEIVLEDNQYEACDIDKKRVYYINEIYRLDFSEELKDAIWQLFISNSGY